MSTLSIMFLWRIGVNYPRIITQYTTLTSPLCIVSVEVLRPSQPNGVMSSAVSLPNHTFNGQA